MSKGITLIETIIGLAILSFGLLAVIAAFPLGLKTLDTNYRSNSALFLASNKIEEIRNQEYQNLESGVFIEDFGEISDFENYKRETKINCFSPDGQECDDNSQIKKIEVTVFFKSENNQKSTLTTLITER
jgi:Tfp pilus assembly protein PilV